MLGSSCDACNNFSLYDNVNLIYEEEKLGTKLREITISHACSSHFIKQFRKKMKEFFPNKKKHVDQRKIAAVVMTRLIHSESLETANVVFEYFVRIFCLEFEDASLVSDVDALEKFNGDEMMKDENEDFNGDDVEIPELCGKMKGSK